MGNRIDRTQAEIHDLLRRQYGLVSGGLFMPHATVKGFFRSDAEPEAMIASLDATMQGWRPFVAYNNGVIRMGRAGIVISAKSMPDGSDNEAWHELQDRAWAAIAEGRPNPLGIDLPEDPALQRFLPQAEIARRMDAADYVGDAPMRARALAASCRERLNSAPVLP